MYKINIKGVVQGVGFRPFIYRECVKRNLKGYVKNTGNGVEVVVDDIEKFKEILEGKIPPLARIEGLEINEIYGNNDDDITMDKFNSFKILDSIESEGICFVPADGFLCNDCLRELRDKENYRHNYFFITCTNCGPRFTILEKPPYDRINTSMKDFEMCEICKKEYEKPLNRRYHAQTIACPNCGPQQKIYKKRVDENNDVKFEEVFKQEQNEIFETAKLIKKGNIVAIKGIGGFHLAGLATNKNIVGKIRKFEKNRESKPFAIMVKDIEMAKKFAFVDEMEENLLKGKARPIVILQKKDKNVLKEVSDLDTLGIMLPYTGVHFLLFDHLDEPLIMTSSNRSDTPITTDLHQQFADFVLDHDRKILNPLDDSVIKVINKHPLFIRRSRGYVPEAIKISEEGENEKEKWDEKRDEYELIAVGAEMMNTFCLYKRPYTILSGYLGDTKSYDVFENFKENLQKFLNFASFLKEKDHPLILIRDLHPFYNTSTYAEEMYKNLRENNFNVKVIKLQHHLAHVYSVAGENGLNDFVGIACDGTGYGSDGKIWGGEIFDCGKEDERIASLEEQVMPGGDSAVIYPQKMLFGILCKFLSEKEIESVFMPLKFYSKKEIEILYKQYTSNFNITETTSCGRILDAAAALLKFCDKRTYDGEPAMKLEANSADEGYYLKPVIECNSEGKYILKTTPIFKFILENIDKDKGKLACTVQQYLAEGLFEIAKKFNKRIVFGGGCAYNRIMTSFLTKNDVLVNKKVPSGDGGISFGQVYYALRRERK